VRFLNKRLEELEIVERVPKDTDKIFFGAWVTLENEAGEEQHWRIVGPDEFDLNTNKLSIDSPLARSLLGKCMDDEIQVQSPAGEQVYYVTGIRYEHSV
jgi:transcription elongation factor GreB